MKQIIETTSRLRCLSCNEDFEGRVDGGRWCPTCDEARQTRRRTMAVFVKCEHCQGKGGVFHKVKVDPLDGSYELPVAMVEEPAKGKRGAK